MISDRVRKHFSGKRVGLLGFGRSNRAVCDFLLPSGAVLTVYDEKTEGPDAARYRRAGVRFVTGPFPPVFEEDILFRSPGIRPDLPGIRACLSSGGELSGETELFLSACPCRLFGVTGSDGKSTTTALLRALLETTGQRVYSGGNNGVSLLPYLDGMRETDFAVLELSSFQLMTLAAFPGTAVITNLTPNHLNWHHDFAEYRAAKAHILQGATRLVLSVEDAECRRLARGQTAPIAFFTSSGAGELPPGGQGTYYEGDVLCVRAGSRLWSLRIASAYRLPGIHNRKNLAAAAAAAFPFLTGVPGDALLSALFAFGGVPHRLQTVCTVGGVTYIDSSIDTSPTRTAAALSTFSKKPLVIAGGRGKGISLSPLADTLAAGACAVFLYGETATEILTDVNDRIPAVAFSSFREAFEAASSAAQPGDTVLLSPGCTAFGEFRDFEERGDFFTALAREKSGKETK